jgi:hypothetical protein
MPSPVGGAMCRNHPAVPAVDRCAGCAEPFCGNCLVDMNGRKYCGSCKVMALQGQPLNYATGMAIPNKDADEALKYAIISIFCFSFILGPIAISKAMKAKKAMAVNPNLTGSGKATAAMIIGIITTVLGVLQLIMIVTRQNSRGY